MLLPALSRVAPDSWSRCGPPCDSMRSMGPDKQSQSHTVFTIRFRWAVKSSHFVVATQRPRNMVKNNYYLKLSSSTVNLKAHKHLSAVTWRCRGSTCLWETLFSMIADLSLYKDTSKGDLCIHIHPLQIRLRFRLEWYPLAFPNWNNCSLKCFKSRWIYQTMNRGLLLRMGGRGMIRLRNSIRTKNPSALLDFIGSIQLNRRTLKKIEGQIRKWGLFIFYADDSVICESTHRFRCGKVFQSVYTWQ